MKTVTYLRFRELGEKVAFLKSEIVISATASKHLYILFSCLKSFIILIQISEVTRAPGMLAVWCERGK